MKASINKEGTELTVIIPVAKTKELSKSGKSYTVATSNGNQGCAMTVFGSNEVVKVGVNAFIIA